MSGSLWRRRALAGLGLAAVAATFAVGLWLRLVDRHPLGTPLPPLLMSYAPHLSGWAIVAVAVAAACVAVAPWLVRRAPGPAFGPLVYALTVALGLGVNLARRGPAGWDHVFQLNGTGSFEASREYLPALVDLRQGVAHYVRDFPQLLPHLPTHTKGNPPGPLVAMHLLHITTPARLAAACIVVGALAAPLAGVLARELGPGEGVRADRRGRIAAVLTAFSPSVVIFGVTSVDYAFAGLATAVAALLLARSRGLRVAGCVLAGIAAFCSYVLLAIPVWAVLCTLRREGLMPAVRLALGALAGIVAVTLVLALAWGYDPIAILHVVRHIYARGAAAHRPYAFWVFGSPAAFVFMLGAPIAWLALMSLGALEPAVLALLVVIAVSTLTGTTKGETERIWLPYVPLACAAAAARPVRRLLPLLLLLAAQAVAIELLFGTTW